MQIQAQVKMWNWINKEISSKNLTILQVWKELLLQEFSRWLVTPGELGWNTTLQDIWTRDPIITNQGFKISDIAPKTQNFVNLENRINHGG